MLLWQLTGIVVTVASAVTMGIIVGFVVSRLGRKQTPYEDKDEFLNADEENIIN